MPTYDLNGVPTFSDAELRKAGYYDSPEWEAVADANRERAAREWDDAYSDAPDPAPRELDQIWLTDEDRELCGLPAATPDERSTRRALLQANLIPDLPAGWAAKHLTAAQRERFRAGYAIRVKV